MGVVYRAYDRQRKMPVALKTCHDRSIESLLHLKEEFRTLSDVVHPNLVALYDLLSESGHWFFTMELLEGVDFYRFVRPSSESADFGRLRTALRQLVEGVDALHHAGILHRDLKPSNVLVTPAGSVVVLDFGLATGLRDQTVNPAAIQYVRGTVSYMSPEQCAARPLTTASDWYSIGLMLYEALTGRLPFRGSSLRIVHDKQTLAPPAPSDLVQGIPEDLNAVCRDLLQIEPGRRPSGNGILSRLGSIRSSTPKAFGADDALLPFVGREE